MFLLRNGVTFGKLEIEPLKQAPHIVDVHSDGKGECVSYPCAQNQNAEKILHMSIKIQFGNFPLHIS